MANSIYPGTLDIRHLEISYLGRYFTLLLNYIEPRCFSEVSETLNFTFNFYSLWTNAFTNCHQ